MKEWVVALGMLGFGSFLAWSGYRSIRNDLHIHGIPWIEHVILSTVDEKPLPKTRLDHVLGSLHHWLSIIFGPIIAALGGLILASRLGAL